MSTRREQASHPPAVLPIIYPRSCPIPYLIPHSSTTFPTRHLHRDMIIEVFVGLLSHSLYPTSMYIPSLSVILQNRG
jgi:hypothetical protein